jgi:hypothetical protein
MQYNSHASSQDIVTMCEKLSRANSVSFPIAEKTLYANQAMRIIWSWIHEAYGGWIYDDSNQTDLPEATTAVVSGQDTYTLPTDVSFVLGVSIKDIAGNWSKLSPVTLEMIQEGGAESDFLTTDGNPLYYRLIGNQIKIYPATNYSQSASLKVHYTRDISSFATTDTTKTPGFDSAYHEAVPTFMALQYAKINQLANKNDLDLDWQRYELRIKSDYSRRFAELFPPRIGVSDATSEYI